MGTKGGGKKIWSGVKKEVDRERYQGGGDGVGRERRLHVAADGRGGGGEEIFEMEEQRRRLAGKATR